MGRRRSWQFRSPHAAFSGRSGRLLQSPAYAGGKCSAGSRLLSPDLGKLSSAILFGADPGRRKTMADDKQIANTKERSDADRRGGNDDRRRENLTAADVIGWDGDDRRQEDRRTAQERRRDERLAQDVVWEKDAIDGFWPMDSAAQAAHDKRQAERRDRDRRAADRRRMQMTPQEVADWDGAERRVVEEDRRDIERRELERRIRAAKIADMGSTPGV